VAGIEQREHDLFAQERRCGGQTNHCVDDRRLGADSLAVSRVPSLGPMLRLRALA
jgi:hypothetical protein